MTYQYRDGVFSASSPAPRYGTLPSVFENGSLGGLEEDAAQAIDPMLDQFTVEMAVTVKDSRNSAAVLSGATAVNLAKAAREASDINEKLALTIAAGYAASHFGLPQNSLLATVNGVCDTFVMTSNQRNALHQQALALYKSYLVQQEKLQKGNPMSGVFRDGVLGGAYQDGVLGAAAFRDGSLGALTAADRVKAAVMARKLGTKPARDKFGFLLTVPQQRQSRDGSLGLTIAERRSGLPTVWSPPGTPGWSGGGSRLMLDKTGLPIVPRNKRARIRPVAGLGGCGCAGVGAEDPVVEETSRYKAALLVTSAAMALGLVFYALNRK